MAVRILVYDDSDVIRESLRALLFEEPDFEVIAMLPNAETVETDINELKPDVVLMDIDMPEVNGVEAVKRIRKLNPELPIIMLTVFDDNERVFQSICAGASGYLLKRTPPAKIIDAVFDVASGGGPMTASIARKVLEMFPRFNAAKSDTGDLSPREQEILGRHVRMDQARDGGRVQLHRRERPRTDPTRGHRRGGRGGDRQVLQQVHAEAELLRRP